jgi:hypothetical protein
MTEPSEFFLRCDVAIFHCQLRKPAKGTGQRRSKRRSGTEGRPGLIRAAKLAKRQAESIVR